MYLEYPSNMRVYSKFSLKIVAYNDADQLTSNQPNSQVVSSVFPGSLGSIQCYWLSCCFKRPAGLIPGNLPILDST